jgi:RNA polymerase sigma-70 factor (ECF subfamily)
MQRRGRIRHERDDNAKVSRGLLSQSKGERRLYNVNAPGNAIEAAVLDDAFDFETFFHVHYERIARAIAQVVRDPARAEEIAAEAFWKFWRNPQAAQGGQAKAWLYRTAVRMAIDELRKEARRIRNESLQVNRQPAKTPEEVHAAAEERDRVRLVLASLDARQAELLLLRSNDLSYSDVAAALDLNPASVGTLIIRAQQAFRKEYVTQYGEPNYER